MQSSPFPSKEPPRTVDEMFRAAVAAHPDRDFIVAVEGNQHLTYKEVARQVDALTESLAAHGVIAGDRIVFFLEASLPTILMDLACAHMGVVPVPLSPTFSARALAQLCTRTNARAVFTDRTHAAIPEASPPVLHLGEGGNLDATPKRSAADAAARLTSLPQHGPASCFLFQPTSGTTGEPKIIMRSHAVFDRVARVHARDIPESPQRLLLVAALTHGMGQYALATALHLAGTLCLPTAIDTDSNLQEIRALDPTLLFLTPRVMRALHEQRTPGDARWFGPSAFLVYCGGAATQPELLRRLVDDGIFVSEGYGASEISLLSQTLPGRWKEGTSGEVIPDVTLRTAEDGELLAKSPGAMIGYFDDAELTRQAFTDDGFYRTGDYAKVEDGYLRYLGRKRDVFNTNEGANVHPGRIEALVEHMPGVKQAVLVGDQRKYLAALIVVDGAASGAAAGVTSSAPDGFLDEREHAALYERIRTALQPMNDGLEAIERVRRFALFATPFPTEMYRLVGHAKVSRNRRLLEEGYAARISSLYT
ncbi:MAG: AMP-binding protein [Polyangia bacterium]